MDMIELAREIGREIQKDESYIKMRVAEQACESDEQLQKLIEDFNVKRVAVNIEASKSEKNEEKVEELNKKMRHIYAEIMQNENMIASNNAKREVETKLQRVMAIIQNSAEGDDPDTTDYVGSCTGSCATCGGCH